MLGSARLQYRQCAQNPPTAETHRQTLNAENHGKRERSCARSRVFPFEKRANMPRFCAATAQQKKFAGAARGLGASCRRAALGCSSSCGLALRRNRTALHFADTARLRADAFRAASRIDLPKILDACFPRVSSKLRLERGASFLRMPRFRDTGHAGASFKSPYHLPLPKTFRREVEACRLRAYNTC